MASLKGIPDSKSGFQIRYELNQHRTIDMKKTLTFLAALGAFSASVQAATVFNYYTPGADNYNSAIHGFFLGLDSSALAPVTSSGSPASLSGDIRLDSFTLRGPASNTGINITYGFLVLNASDNTVVGLSTNTGTSGNGVNLTFNFSAVDGSSLILDAGTTYRYLAVSQAVMDIVNGDTSKAYLYNAGGTNTATSSVNGDTVTISQGLAAPGIRGHHDSAGAPGDSVVITGANGSNTFAQLSPIFTEIRGEVVPEPATATLGLLGLAALMVRRRRV